MNSCRFERTTNQLANCLALSTPALWIRVVVREEIKIRNWIRAWKGMRLEVYEIRQRVAKQIKRTNERERTDERENEWDATLCDEMR